MIQVTATMRILVAIEPVDLRKGIDGLAQFCREKLAADPFSGCLFIFRSRCRPLECDVLKQFVARQTAIDVPVAIGPVPELLDNPQPGQQASR